MVLLSVNASISSEVRGKDLPVALKQIMATNIQVIQRAFLLMPRIVKI